MGKKKKTFGWALNFFFFCMKICECSKGKQMKGQTHQTAEGQQQLLTHLEVDRTLTWSQTSSLSEGQWILTTYLSQEQAGLMAPGATGDRDPGRCCWGALHCPIPMRNHLEQRGRSQNNPAVPYKQACRVQQGWWLPLKYLAFAKLLVSHKMLG